MNSGDVMKCMVHSPLLMSEEGRIKIETTFEREEPKPISWTRNDITVILSLTAAIAFLLLLCFFLIYCTSGGILTARDMKKIGVSYINGSYINMTDIVSDVFNSTLTAIKDEFEDNGEVEEYDSDLKVREVIMEALHNRKEIIINNVFPLLCKKYGLKYGFSYEYLNKS